MRKWKLSPWMQNQTKRQTIVPSPSHLRNRFSSPSSFLVRPSSLREQPKLPTSWREITPLAPALWCVHSTPPCHTSSVYEANLFLSSPLCLLLSLSFSLSPFSSSSFLPLHFFPRSRFRYASLLIATEYDPAIPLSLVHFRWIINQLPLCEASRGPTADAVRSSNRK